MTTITALNADPRSLWRATSASEVDTYALEEPIEADVVVVGAGFTGLRAALELAQANCRVVVLESNFVGWGASGRNGGQVNPMPPFNGPAELYQAVGPVYGDRITELYLDSANELFGLIKDHNIECGARQNGWIRVDHSAEARKQNAANACAWNQIRPVFEQVDGDRLVQMTGTNSYTSAVVNSVGGAVHPYNLAHGLAAAAMRAGAEIFTDSPVKTMTRQDRRWHVATPNDRVVCERLLLCTNGYTDSLYPGLEKSVVPLVSIQVASDPLSEEQVGHLLPGGQTISDSRRVIMFARREPDNRFVYGSLGQANRHGVISGFETLINDLRRVFPSLRNVEWKYRWGGHVAMTADHIPHMHEPEPGVLSGLGYNGRGVAMSHVMGRLLAERAIGKAAEDLPIPVTSIKGFPMHAAHRLGSRIVAEYMRFRDRLEFRP
jgi:glycine/D-amino acid oxidase-like deaminating enzyme